MYDFPDFIPVSADKLSDATKTVTKNIFFYPL